ncbi:MAG: signal peptidase II [Candidatus Aminicenantes bacterium]|nr:MAG: signal peptidase II [Candidatus Aminicenantes bacterium]
MNRRSFYFLFILFFLIVDQLTKFIISRSIGLNNSLSVIPGFFDLVHVRNKGAIFGIFSQSGSQVVHILLMLASLVALALVIYYFFKTAISEKLLKISLSLILAGALGNLIDRIFRGYVIDFLDFSIKGWHWPSFNVADSCISVGALLLIFILFFKRSPKCSQSL